ncbi:MAG: hypothetical protein LKJ17_00245 [Oscillospiraceae bacterium]|jgi:hypothetical protein|nr:hypothetical protein [Oscillospiraceae bacterium]
MLGKLLKYELKATARIFFPLYGLIFLLAALNRLFWQINAEGLMIPRVIMMTVYIMLVVSVFIITLVVTIQRFYKNLLGDEGYLSFTLPVKTHSHIDAKMIITFLWSALSILVSIISIFILVADDQSLTQFSLMCGDIATVYHKLGLSAHLIALELIVVVILMFVSSILEIYAAIVVGNLAGRHKLLAGVGAYLGFGIIEQIIASLLIQGFGHQIMLYYDSFQLVQGAAAVVQPFEMTLLVLIVFSLFLCAAFYFFTHWMLNRKLNLE